MTLEGDANGAPHPKPGAYAKKFSGKYRERTIPGGVGHNLPQEAPEVFARAVVDDDKFESTGFVAFVTIRLPPCLAISLP